MFDVTINDPFILTLKDSFIFLFHAAHFSTCMDIQRVRAFNFEVEPQIKEDKKVFKQVEMSYRQCI